MLRRNQNFLHQLNMALDMVIAFLTMLGAYWIRFNLFTDAVHSLGGMYYVLLAVASAVLHAMLYSLLGFYRLNRNISYAKTLSRIFTCEFACMLVILGALFVFHLMNISRWTIVIAFVLQMLAMGVKELTQNAAFRHYHKKGYNQKHILLVGSGESARHYFGTVTEHCEYGYHVIGYCAAREDWDQLPYLGSYEELSVMLAQHDLDEVLIALPAEDYIWIERIIHDCEQTGTHMQIIPCYDKYISSKMAVEMVDGINLIHIRQVPLDMVQNAMIKRTVDILMALFVLLLTSPILLMAAVGIRLSSPGPVIFKQERIGKNKKVFFMYKFRSMRMNSEENSAWSSGEDSRRTAFGSILRKYSIDELPQFVNVLKGDMSVVGPRPEIPFYVEQFKDEIPLYMVKHYVKPGITGWAQVNGLRGDTSIRGRVEHDIYYIENWTLGFDLRIMFRTLFHLKNEEQINVGGTSV